MDSFWLSEANNNLIIVKRSDSSRDLMLLFKQLQAYLQFCGLGINQDQGSTFIVAFFVILGLI